MGRYISQAPRVKKQQVFTVSGTFTPSPGLLAAGGVVEVRCVGGGGGGGGHNHKETPCGGGGGSGADISRIVVISGAVPVTVGAGGSASGINGGEGGTTGFGTLISAPGGHGAMASSGGKAGGEGGVSGASGIIVKSQKYYTNVGGSQPNLHYPSDGGGPGCGGGGAAPGGNGGLSNGSPGQSGFCIVTWEE